MTARERPILYTGEMVRAVIANQKTKTRRVMKPQPPAPGAQWSESDKGFRLDGSRLLLLRACPYGVPGDRLWVRETWQALDIGDYTPTKRPTSEVRYKATDKLADSDKDVRGYPWRPSIFMPHWASRITLELTSVRVERVQDISEEDAIAEGVGSGFQCNGGWPDYQHIRNGVCDLTQDTAKMSYASLWDSINGKRPGCEWADNPWVWVLAFRMVQP